MNREVFDDAVCRLVEHCECSALKKAMSLLFVAVALVDAESVNMRGRLCSAEELEEIIGIVYAKVRSTCGTNGATPPEGVQA